jgi:putative addiction module component (TIGR02574 family)
LVPPAAEHYFLSIRRALLRVWDHPFMGRAAALDVAELSRDEKLELLDRLWASLGQDPEALPLTSAQKDELDRRLDELEVEGPTGVSWDEVVAQARAGVVS